MVPRDRPQPSAAYRSAPPSRISGTAHKVTTLCTRVGRLKSPSSAGSGGFGGVGLAGGVGTSERSETSVMLIVYFDEHDTVRDYKISQTKF